jgi:hypothetical protein
LHRVDDNLMEIPISAGAEAVTRFGSVINAISYYNPGVVKQLPELAYMMNEGADGHSLTTVTYSCMVPDTPSPANFKG